MYKSKIKRDHQTIITKLFLRIKLLITIFGAQDWFFQYDGSLHLNENTTEWKYTVNAAKIESSENDHKMNGSNKCM